MQQDTGPKNVMQDFNLDETEFYWDGGLYDKDDVAGLKRDIIRHIVSSLGSDYARHSPYNYYHGLALAMRDRLIDLWIKTQRSYYVERGKRVYYLSLEYLPGKSLLNTLHCLGMYETASKAVGELNYTLEELAEVEWDAGLGNGGLGRLASCYLDSIASLDIPGYGYGILYDYGIFHQTIENGEQVEKCDNWMRTGSPWVFQRGRFMTAVKFGGRVIEYTDETGRLCHQWVDAERVMAMACDMLVPGYGNKRVINMRLWAARSDMEFRLDFFNTGDYVGAVEGKVQDENISKVLYPSEEALENRELRLKQQYFFVAATLKDIFRRYKKRHKTFDEFPDWVAIQLNDTHPSIAVPELMRLLLDKEGLSWETAWDVCTRTFGYTNHTIMPEALETWPIEMLEKVLPRHLQIIYEINQRFLDSLPLHGADDDERRAKLSIIQEYPQRAVRMAHLAIVGSRVVNGVSALHSTILRERVLKDFSECYPDKFINVTNGITPRRWLLSCNRSLASLLSERIGKGWICDLNVLKDLIPHAEDPHFRRQWQDIRMGNKKRLAAYIKRKLNIEVDTNSLFDVQVKRIHEYKRQLMNVFHVITLYNRIKARPEDDYTPRTVIFAGKAAPAYYMAKLIIRLINAVANVVNHDPIVRNRLKVLFLPNYCVSQAERIIPATDLSEQISTAGMEASGTGNMKFALNGSLIIGTLDGANIEILEEVGPDNIFIFGRTATELAALRHQGYNPWTFYSSDKELKQVMDMLLLNTFSPRQPGLFKPIFDALLYSGDHFFVLADYRSYIQCQDKVNQLYHNQDEWTRRSILNTANMGKFSSDRAIREYAERIWRTESLGNGMS